MTEAAHQGSQWIAETTDATFEHDVVERSRDVPVVLDFWAPWCGPCRQLGPILERLAAEYDGRFVLVKANTDEAPRASMEFGVQGIPAVFGVRDGQPVDFFTGALPEPQVRAWIDRLLPSEVELLVSAGRKLADDDASAAEAKFREAIQFDEDLPSAKIALAELLAGQEREQEASALIVELEQRGYLEPEAERVKALLELKGQQSELGSIDECRQAAAANPDDYDARLRLGEALAAGGEYDQALPLLLELVEQDRHATGEKARGVMLDVFRLLPEDAELLHEYQRKLSTAL